MLHNMIFSSMNKYGGEAPPPPQSQDPQQDPNASMQTGAPVSDPNAQQVTNPTANPMDLMGQVLQNVVKSVNQMIDIYSAMSGNQPVQSDNTMDQGQQGAPVAGPPTNAPAGDNAPPPQGKSAGLTWADVFKGS